MGTLDLVADLADGQRWLLDWKTTASGIWPESALQLAAYRNADFYIDDNGDEQPMPPVDQAGCVWLSADGYDLIPVDAGPDTFRSFRYASRSRSSPARPASGSSSRRSHPRGRGMSVVPYTQPADPASRQWVELMQPAIELAKAVAGTDFVPKAMRNNPAAITAAILYGDEVGLGPMQSLAKISVIDGRPSLAAEAQRALILAAGHDLWIEESTTTRCTVAGRRRDSDQTSRVTWTWTTPNAPASPGNPTGGPTRGRCSSPAPQRELARAVFADAIGGLAATEELDDDGTPHRSPPRPTTTTGRNRGAQGDRPRAGAGRAPPPAATVSAPARASRARAAAAPRRRRTPASQTVRTRAAEDVRPVRRARDARPRHPTRVGQPAARPRTRDRRAAHRHRNLDADRRAPGRRRRGRATGGRLVMPWVQDRRPPAFSPQGRRRLEARPRRRSAWNSSRCRTPPRI